MGDRVILSNTPQNVTITADLGAVKGAFIGAVSTSAKTRHVFPLGKLKGSRFMCCFRFKLWWMMQRMGKCACEIPHETQFLLVEDELPSNSDHCDIGTLYTVFLPILEGPFRASLQGNEQDELEMCIESGDESISTMEVQQSVYVHCGSNPYTVIAEAVKAVEAHTHSFMRREQKQMPPMLDYFGWCTWDAFYTDVTVEGIHEGLSSLAGGGVPAQFLIIDDGWQSVEADSEPSNGVAITAGTQYASRLTDIRENEKFKRLVEPSIGPERIVGLGDVVREAKAKHNLKYVYVWHAMTGYWGGVQPSGPATSEWGAAVVYPVNTPGVLKNQPEMAEDSLVINGVGLVAAEKAFQFYDALHAYLATSGIDGVKVDAQAILETMGAGQGGRVAIARKFHAALDASVKKNFAGNSIMACMSHSTDALYSAMQTALMRASDDFWPRDPASHTVHIAAVAYNSFFLGEFMQPDWDMFHSLHPAAAYHAAARIVGGCAIYVSDKPGEHDFQLLKRLVLPDGSVLRARLPGRPTRDCLFVDPLYDSVSVLKIWNSNRYTGIVGAFNCQGAGWVKEQGKYMIHDPNPKAVSDHLRATDVDNLHEVAHADWNGDVAVYSTRTDELLHLANGASFPFSLQQMEYHLFCISPIKVFNTGLKFAPVGLANMFNAGGAIESLTYYHGTSSFSSYSPLVNSDCGPEDWAPFVEISLCGCGTFIAFSSQEPSRCTVDEVNVPFSFNPVDGRLSLELVFLSGHSWQLRIFFFGIDAGNLSTGSL